MMRWFGRSRRALGLSLLLVLSAAGAADTDDPGDRLAEAGRAIYVEGRLPDGAPLRALRPEGFVMEGEYAACVTCHRESGMGSVEGQLQQTVLVPPIAGPVLFAPARFHGTFLDASHHWVPNAAWERALTRDAYDEQGLARALRTGLDPDGRSLVAPMPRYALDDRAVAALAAYLHGLSAEPSPGVGADALRLATVVTPDARADQADAVLGVVRAWSAASRASGTGWSLRVWQLSGPPEGWEEQLEAKYREQPVFALLSGVGGAEWGPVQRFCETRRIPCVLPVLDATPDEAPRFYSVYFSPGVVLEARVLASYLEAGSAGGGTQPMLQVFSDASGQRAAAALTAALGAETAATRQQRFRPTAPTAGMASLADGSALVLWLRPDEIGQLAAIRPEPPGTGPIYLSALLAPPEAVALPPAWKARVTYLSLYDDFGIQGEIAALRLRRWLDGQGLALGRDPRPQADAYAACYLFAKSLGGIRGQEVRRPPVPLTREHVLETLETLVNKYADGTPWVDPDSHVAPYGRMSLGPRQRTAVRGGMLMRYASPDSDRLVAASDRILP